jgi:hypothetical protein
MGGNNNNHGGCANDDPFAKVKFSIPSFSGLYDVETYLDWEMMVEQKFSSHLVPEQHKIQQATSEFKDFAIIWWNGLAAIGGLPMTWEGLKVAISERFVPPSYQRDLRKKSYTRADDEDITKMNIHNTSPADIQGPITRARS